MGKLIIVSLSMLINVALLHSGDSLSYLSSNSNVYSNYLNHQTMLELSLGNNTFNNIGKATYSASGLINSNTIPEELLANSQFGYNITDYFALKSYNDIKYNGDVKTNNVSLVENKNLIGFGLALENSSANFYYGKEFQQILGFNSFSNAGRLELETSNKYSGYHTDAKYNYNKINRSFNRNYSLHDVRLSTQKLFSPDDRIGVYFDLKNLDNDRIIGSVNENNPVIQEKKQKLYNIGTKLAFRLGNNVSSQFSLYYSSGKYSKNVPIFGDEQKDIHYQNTTNIEDVLKFSNNLDLDLKFLSNRLTIEMNSRSFINSITSTDENKKSLLKKNARERDKEIFEILIANKFKYKISIADTIGINVSYKSSKEDTPSDNENSDSDRLLASAELFYIKHYSPLFSSVFKLGSRLQHIVWLKKEYSAGNNVLQTLLLDAGFYYNYNRVSLKPKIGISVEYLSKDFPSLSEKYSGKAIRRFFVSDSITVTLKERFPIHIEYYYHYRESGDYDKKSFTQTINNKKEEFILRSLLYYKNENEDLFGIGLRYFLLRDGVVNSNVDSFGPEAEIVLRVFDKWKLSLKSWLEFRLDGNSEKFMTVPNINLNTEIGI